MMGMGEGGRGYDVRLSASKIPVLYTRIEVMRFKLQAKYSFE